MRVADKIVVVTGAASGIGRALAQRFAREGARHIVCADLNGDGAAATATGINASLATTTTNNRTTTSACRVDVSNEQDIIDLIERTEREQGPIDLFCSNAGIGLGRGLETSNSQWEKIWQVNLMSHVYAARHLVPRMAVSRKPETS